MDREMSLEELDEIMAGVNPNAVLMPNDGEMTEEQLDHIMAGIPVQMVDAQKAYIESLASEEQEHSCGCGHHHR